MEEITKEIFKEKINNILERINFEKNEFIYYIVKDFYDSSISISDDFYNLDFYIREIEIKIGEELTVSFENSFKNLMLDVFKQRYRKDRFIDENFKVIRYEIIKQRNESLRKNFEDFIMETYNIKVDYGTIYFLIYKRKDSKIHKKYVNFILNRFPDMNPNKLNFIKESLDRIFENIRYEKERSYEREFSQFITNTCFPYRFAQMDEIFSKIKNDIVNENKLSFKNTFIRTFEPYSQSKNINESIEYIYKQVLIEDQNSILILLLNLANKLGVKIYKHNLEPLFEMMEFRLFDSENIELKNETIMFLTNNKVTELIK